MHILYKARKVPKQVEVGAEWWVAHTTFTQGSHPCETKPHRSLTRHKGFVAGRLYVLHTDGTMGTFVRLDDKQRDI